MAIDVPGLRQVGQRRSDQLIHDSHTRCRSWPHHAAASRSGPSRDEHLPDHRAAWRHRSPDSWQEHEHLALEVPGRLSNTSPVPGRAAGPCRVQKDPGCTRLHTDPLAGLVTRHAVAMGWFRRCVTQPWPTAPTPMPTTPADWSPPPSANRQRSATTVIRGHARSRIQGRANASSATNAPAA